MMLLTKANRASLPPIKSQDRLGLDAIARVKFFTPSSSFTWYASEFDGEDRFFGLVTSHLCPEGELGYFSLSELESIKGPLGLGVERDRYFTPAPLRECVGK